MLVAPQVKASPMMKKVPLTPAVFKIGRALAYWLLLPSSKVKLTMPDPAARAGAVASAGTSTPSSAISARYRAGSRRPVEVTLIPFVLRRHVRHRQMSHEWKLRTAPAGKTA